MFNNFDSIADRVTSSSQKHYNLSYTTTFKKWLQSLAKKDQRLYKIVVKRLRAVEDGNFGRIKSVGDKVSEIRIFEGPGVRLYFTRVGNQVIFFLAGGVKDSQPADIEKAKKLAAQIHAKETEKL